MANKLLKQLTEAVGVSGDEREVRTLIRDLIQDHVDSIELDPMGNLIALKKGTGASDLKVMIDAHMDEVGFLIMNIDGNGTLRFANVGGFDSRSLLGKVVQVGPKKKVGVIGSQPIHLASSAERNRITPQSSMRIDVGAKGKDGGGIKVGDRATFLTPYEEVGDIAFGKAFDDRAGCALMIELLKGDPFPFDLYTTFTVQEEVGLRGPQITSERIQPDIAFVLDCTPALDLPPLSESEAHPIEEHPNASLGRGPAVYVMDRSSIQDPRLVKYLLKTAEKYDLPIQVRRPGGGGTNTAPVQRGGPPVATVAMSLPGRYLHAPCSMISLTDYKNMLDLLRHALTDLSADVLQRPA